MTILLSKKHYDKLRDLLYRYNDSLQSIEDLTERAIIHEIIVALNVAEKEQ